MTIGPRAPLNHEPPIEPPRAPFPAPPHPSVWAAPPPPPVKPRPGLMERFRGWLLRVLRA